MDKMVFSFSIDLIHDKRKDDWKLLADVPLSGEPTLELAEFLRDGESYVNGEAILSRATELGSMAGQRHAERMLIMESRIPESWREFVLVFPGTVWQGTDGYRYVPYLSWNGDEWRLRSRWLELGWTAHLRLVRLSK